MTNLLEKHIPEVSFKIDAEDLQIITDVIKKFGSQLQPNYLERLENKMHITLLKEALYKFETKLLEKKGTVKEFMIKLKPAQAFSVFQLLLFSQKDYDLRSYETTVLLRVRDLLHKKLREL